MLTLPCDTPFLPRDLRERLSATVMPAAVAASGGRDHPSCALWQVGAAAAGLPAYLASGRASLRGFADTIGMARVEWHAAPIDPFFNVNAPADLAQAEAWLQKSIMSTNSPAA